MKKAIVVGASSGIGKALAGLLAKNGYRVGIAGRRTELLNALQNEKPENYIVKSFDVTETEKIVHHLEELCKELGGLDLIIISSGTGDLNPSLDFQVERNAIDTNIIAFTCISGWALTYFQNKKSGHLVGITSVGGLRGSRHAPAYNASKSYQINYLEGLRQKANHLNVAITVTDIRPGFVDTAMAKGEGKFWIAPVDKAARQILSAIQRKKKIAYITKRWALIAVLAKLSPRILYDRM